MTLNALLKLGHAEFRGGRYSAAIAAYEHVKVSWPELSRMVDFNIGLAQRRRAREGNLQAVEPGIYSRYMARAVDEGVADDEALRGASTYSPVAEGPLVSVIMPTWNRGFVIGEAIRSVLDQSYENWELIICDDASEDETPDVVSLYDDSRVKYHRLAKGNGAIARNHGLNIARGGIIAFLDSDNIWHPRYLEKVVRAHVSHDQAIVYTGMLDCLVTEDKVVDVTPKFSPFDWPQLSWRNFIDLNTFSFHRSLLPIYGGFDPKLPRQQDWDFIARYTLNHTPYGLGQPLVFYRRAEGWGQVTTTKKHIDTRSVVLEKIQAYRVAEHTGLPTTFREYPTVEGEVLRKIAIKISAPNEGVAHEWGDYHFAHQLGKALFRLGWEYEVHCQDSWYTSDADVNIVIRGRHRFDIERSQAHSNFVWIISHPDRLAAGELDDFDHIFVASESFVDKVQKATSRPASVLHQATDPEVFSPDGEKVELPADVVFIGNSRNQFRTMVKWSQEVNLDVAIWGTRWEQFIEESRIQGDHIPNKDLPRYYKSSTVVLNDHWENMSSNGFISNRLFDASAAGAFVITDPVVGLEEVFGDTIAVAKSAEDLKALVTTYTEDTEARAKKAEEARQLVLARHTFDHRAEDIADVIARVRSANASGAT